MILMKKKRVALVLFLIALSGATMIFSQSSGQLNAIQTVVPFLTIAPDSRAGAMGMQELLHHLMFTAITGIQQSMLL